MKKVFLKRLTRSRPYICDDCATEMGGHWPKGHCATVHSGICPYCGKRKRLASIGDYDWPKHCFIDMRD